MPMKYLPEEDTIVALSSPLGKGAIAVIRVSGKDALGVVNPLLKKKLGGEAVRVAQFNEIFRPADSDPIDQVVTTYYKAPHSYTGEDLIEIGCHCNPLIIDAIIGEIIQQGARMAQPGEFTFRAFMNGKMNLSQAEAVAEVINARTRQSLSQSIRHLEGKLSDRIQSIRNEILDYLSLIEISLDFSDEDIEIMPLKTLAEKIRHTLTQLLQLLHTYDYGRLLQEGIKLLILGKPNVGKSSLLNALLQRERAIVSDIPGTTRDYIEASLEIDGLLVQAVDTAGIRSTEDQVEAIGVERALEQLHTTDVGLCLFEAHRELTGDDEALLRIVEAHRQELLFIIVANKIDLGKHPSTMERLNALELPVVEVSALNHLGMEALKSAIRSRLITDESLESEEVVVTSARHKTALEKTITALNHALEAIEQHSTEEIIAVELRVALDHLGEITGETTTEDVLNHIFANFCIGK